MRKNETPILLLSLLVTTGLLGAAYWFLAPQFNLPQVRLNPGSNAPSVKPGERVSAGDRILVAAVTNPAKQAGVQAFANRDFATATTQLTAALQASPNDPEGLIYLNNAQIGDKQALKVVVSVPIGGNLNVAQEILRGVAQAQDEINQRGGINGVLLWVAIANDDNNPDTANQLAATFVKDASILAVIGHNSSSSSIKAAPTYEQGNLVMISATSTAKQLSGIGRYVFRTVPNVRFDAEQLARYLLRTARLRTVGICADAQAPASQSLKEEFTSTVFADGGRVVNTPCDFSAPDFNASESLSQMISSGAEAVLLAPSVDRINQAMDVAQANQGRLQLLGDATLYTIKTLQLGQAEVKGLVLTVAWHPSSIPGNPFAGNATRLWKGPVNWRSATAYDATLAVITGLQQSPSREGLRNALANPNFSAPGAAGPIQFLPSGDRNLPSTLVQVKPGNRAGTGFDFVPLPTATALR